MKKIFKIIPLILFPLVLSSCNIFKPAGNNSSEETSIDPNSTATETIDGVVVSISGLSQTVIGEVIKLTLNMDPISEMPNTITWSSSNAAVLKRGTVTKTDHSCTFSALSAGTATVTAKGTFKEKKTKFEITYDVTVSKPALSGIAFKNKESDENLGYGRYHDLEVVANPSAANLSTINWTMSKSGVVSLDSTTGNKVRVTAGSLTDNVTITATTADGRYSTSCIFRVQEIQYAKWTIMFYMCGSSLESGSDYGESPETMGYASEDIAEMLKASGQPDSVNLVLECGGSEGWKNSKIQSHISSLSRWHIASKTLVHDEDVTYASMGAQSTLQSFMEYGIKTYPAEKYGLILWNHGGAMEGVCYDELAGNDTLSALEVKQAASNARTNKGIADKFEFITYDACLMSVQEIAELNSYNFKYMLSSQETEVGYGYAYDKWLPTVFANPSTVSTKDVLQQIGQTFLTENASAGDQTQSVYDFSYMDSYKTAFNSFSRDLKTLVDNNTSLWSDLKSVVYSSLVQRYGNQYGQSRYDSYDICGTKGLLTVLKTRSGYTSLASKINAVETALGNLVAWEGHQSSITACGMSLFFPYKKSTISKTNYQAQCNFEDWRDFVCTYWNS